MLYLKNNIDKIKFMLQDISIFKMIVFLSILISLIFFESFSYLIFRIITANKIIWEKIFQI